MIVFNYAITKIRVHPKLENDNRVVYNKKIRIGWKWGIIPVYKTEKWVKGWWGDNDISSVEDYNKIATKSYVEGDTAYYKPHCDIYLNDTSKYSKYFETEDELKEYVKELSSLAPHIEI